jgi:hypothetical protein
LGWDWASRRAYAGGAEPEEWVGRSPSPRPSPPGELNVSHIFLAGHRDLPRFREKIAKFGAPGSETPPPPGGATPCTFGRNCASTPGSAGVFRGPVSSQKDMGKCQPRRGGDARGICGNRRAQVLARVLGGRAGTRRTEPRPSSLQTAPGSSPSPWGRGPGCPESFRGSHRMGEGKTTVGGVDRVRRDSEGWEG